MRYCGVPPPLIDVETTPVMPVIWMMFDVMSALRLTSVWSVKLKAAGVLSLVGAGYSGVSYLMAPTQGEVAALVREGKTDRPVSEATVEVLTTANTLVTTLAPAADGWARRSLGAGSYHIRATGPGFGSDTKPIQVVAGRTVEVRFQLTPEGRGGGGPVSRFLGKLGL